MHTGDWEIFEKLSNKYAIKRAAIFSTQCGGQPFNSKKSKKPSLEFSTRVYQDEEAPTLFVKKKLDWKGNRRPICQRISYNFNLKVFVTRKHYRYYSPR